MNESSDSSYSIDVLSQTDVLLGRGVGTNRHAGNMYFRKVVNQHVEEYLTSTKTRKIDITRSVIDHIHTLNPPGRFLEKDNATGRWRECDRKRAHEKTAQALRDGAALQRTSKRSISDEMISTSAKEQRNNIVSSTSSTADDHYFSTEPVPTHLYTSSLSELGLEPLKKQHDPSSTTYHTQSQAFALLLASMKDPIYQTRPNLLNCKSNVSHSSMKDDCGNKGRV